MNEPSQKPIYVTRPYLPPLKEYKKYLEQIWKNKIVTNKGPFEHKLEEEMCEFLGVRHISLFCNGTIALIVALKALNLRGEIITTPYSFVATSHAIKWNDLSPVFIDIDFETCNIDSRLIENAITNKTSAILPVHVYGNPCNTKNIKEIADKYDLKIIYDAAHAFGVEDTGHSILSAGDLSVLSFHGTKVFNTFEGGAIVSNSTKMKKRIDDLKNFSFNGELSVTGLGINGKMNEVQAAMGLLQLKYFNKNISERKNIVDQYFNELSNIRGIQLPVYADGIKYNYSYFPIFIHQQLFGCSRDVVYELLKKKNIYSRRYFYPLITQFPEYSSLKSSTPSNLPNAVIKSSEVLCLPIYAGLKKDDINRISSIIKEAK